MSEMSYVVLWDLDTNPIEPCGLAVDYGQRGVRLIQRLGWDTWGNEALEHVEMSA